MREMKRKMVCMGLCFALTGALLTACGSEETAGEEVRGRVTSISDTEITLEITAHQDGERPDKKDFGGASGSAIRKDDMASETKTYSISTSTKFYTQQGEEKTEISSADVELGAMVTVTVSGDEAESITVQTRSQRNSENAEA